MSGSTSRRNVDRSWAIHGEGCGRGGAAGKKAAGRQSHTPLAQEWRAAKSRMSHRVWHPPMLPNAGSRGAHLCRRTLGQLAQAAHRGDAKLPARKRGDPEHGSCSVCLGKYFCFGSAPSLIQLPKSWALRNVHINPFTHQLAVGSHPYKMIDTQVGVPRYTKYTVYPPFFQIH